MWRDFFNDSDLNECNSPVVRQTLLHWAYDLTEEDYKKRVREMKKKKWNGFYRGLLKLDRFIDNIDMF